MDLLVNRAQLTVECVRKNGPGKCDVCNSGYSLDKTNTSCTTCMAENCASCATDPKNCTSCKSGYALSRYSPPTCIKCESYCSSCLTNPPACNLGGCQPGYGHNNATGYGHNNATEYGYNNTTGYGYNNATGYGYNNATGTCQACDDMYCSSCYLDKFECSFCKPGYKLYNSTCRPT